MTTDSDHQEISRRKFLTYIVSGIGAIITAAVAVPVIGYFISPTRKKTTNQTFPIANTSQITVGTPTFIRFEERVADGWVVNTSSEGAWVVTKDGVNFTVYDPHCTHLRCPYYWDGQRQLFLCPCHGAEFDINGKVIAGPPPRPLDIMESFVSGNEIEITGKIIKRQNV